MEAFSADQAKLLLGRHALNLAQRVKDGEKLSPKEVAMLESIASGGGGSTTFVQNQVELAAALNVDRKTIQRWLKKPGHPESAADGRYDVLAWRAFAHKHGGKGSYGDEDESPDVNAAKAKGILLANRKLEIQIKVLEGQYVATSEVERWGAHLGGEIRKTVVSIHKIASSLAGLTPAEIEIRLKEMEDEILMKLHLLSQRTDEIKEAASECED